MVADGPPEYASFDLLLLFSGQFRPPRIAEYPYAYYQGSQCFVVLYEPARSAVETR